MKHSQFNHSLPPCYSHSLSFSLPPSPLLTSCGGFLFFPYLFICFLFLIGFLLSCCFGWDEKRFGEEGRG